MEEDISVQSTKMTKLVKVDPLMLVRLNRNGSFHWIFE